MSVWKRKKRALERARWSRRPYRLKGIWHIQQGEDIIQYSVDLIEEITAAIIADVEATKNG